MTTTVTSRFDASIISGEKAERPEREPEYWRARSERRCKGCRRTFMPQARAELYCKPCSEAGRGWANRKDKQPRKAPERAAEVRQTGYPWDENVLVQVRGSARRYKPYGRCTIADCEAVAARQLGNAVDVIGETRRFALYQAGRFQGLADALRAERVGTVGELPAGVLGLSEERRAA